MNYEAKKGDIVAVQYLYRSKLRSELFTFINYNTNKKELWVCRKFPDGNIITSVIKENNIIDFHRYTEDELNER